MLENIVMRCGPQTSVFESESWNKLEEMLKKRHVQKVLVVHGTISWGKFHKKFPQMQTIEVIFDTFQGECTYEEAKRIAALAKKNQVDALVSVGGGKNNDCVKMAAELASLVVAILPTLAATCAAWTPVCVMYNETGTMIDFPILDKATDILLVDFAILIDSPQDYIVAGIGDTLAKWYESDVIIRQLEEQNTAVMLAHFYAKQCYQNIMEYGVQAMGSLKSKTVDKAFTTIIETNIMLSGMVGGFGDRYARTAGAHAIHDALTLLPQAHHVLHGNKVAYGILIQLLLEKRETEITALQQFYQAMGLPTSLADMGIVMITNEEMLQVAERATLPEEDIHLLPDTITSDKVIAAMLQLEQVFEN